MHPTRYPCRRVQLAAKPCLCACRLPHCSHPSFTPTQASLRNAIERASTPRVGSPQSVPVLQGLDSAYVLIFNAGQQDESVHTVRPKYVPFSTVQANSFVLAFELNDDAGRFALQLQAEGFVSHRPSLLALPQPARTARPRCEHLKFCSGVSRGVCSRRVHCALMIAGPRDPTQEGGRHTRQILFNGLVRRGLARRGAKH